MKIFLIACAMCVTSGCAVFSPSETVFNMTLERAHAVDCNIKSLERSERRTHLECFERGRTNPAQSRSRGERRSEI